MMTILGFGVFSLLAFLGLPVPRARQIALALLQRGLQVSVLTSIGAASVFFARPDLVPADIATFVAPFSSVFQNAVPEGWAPTFWIVAAAVLVAVALPVLAILECAHRIVAQTVAFNRVAREIKRAGAVRGLGHPGGSADVTPEVASALEAAAVLTAAAHNTKDTPQPRRVIDFLLAQK